MALTPELEAIKVRLFKDIDRVIAALDGLDAGQAAWQPAGEGMSSIVQLAAHVLGSTQNMVLKLAGDSFDRQRDAEFLAPGDHAQMPARAQSAKSVIEKAFGALDPARLGDERGPVSSAPAGGSALKVPTTWSGMAGAKTVREFLLQQVAHIAEHAGHAEMTRDLLRARGR